MLAREKLPQCQGGGFRDWADTVHGGGGMGMQVDLHVEYGDGASPGLGGAGVC